MEERIIEVATALFIEKGYAETSMSDIAARVGINRPALHYYFRTKDKMFQAVFSGIVMSIAPSILNVLPQTEIRLEDKVKQIVDAYYKLFTTNPRLPMFIIREMNRDASLLIKTATQVGLPDILNEVASNLRQEKGDTPKPSVPLRFLYYTLYGLMTIPFLTRDLGQQLLLEENETFDAMLEKWKPYIVEQATRLLGR